MSRKRKIYYNVYIRLNDEESRKNIRFEGWTVATFNNIAIAAKVVIALKEIIAAYYETKYNNLRDAADKISMYEISLQIDHNYDDDCGDWKIINIKDKLNLPDDLAKILDNAIGEIIKKYKFDWARTRL